MGPDALLMLGVTLGISAVVFILWGFMNNMLIEAEYLRGYEQGCREAWQQVIRERIVELTEEEDPAECAMIYDALKGDIKLYRVAAVPWPPN